MTYIELLFEEIMSFLSHERKIYTRVFESSPTGSLSIDRSRKNVRWIHRVPAGKDVNGCYRYERKTVSDDSVVLKQLADKEYARSALKILDYNLRILQQASCQMQPYSQEAVLEGMRPAYRQLPLECFQAAQQIRNVFRRQKAWAEEEYEISDYRPEEKIHTTSRGLKVRTRAELLIAEMLYIYDIPFRYEQVVNISRYKMAPDFTFLGWNGNEFYWEYCGMMGSPQYRKHQLWRRRVYEGGGISEWNNMIYTYDAADGIDMREIKAIIETRILPRMRPVN